MAEVKWTDSQLSAIEHTGSDLIISAAAGSGKSATLTERIIRKIKDGKDISKMLIVTFTKAATAELKNKINVALSKELKNDPLNNHISDQILKVGSADICTIDSFCMRLVRPNFKDLGLDANFRIGQASEIDVLEKETISEIIDELYENSTNKSFLLVADCYSSIWSESELCKSLLDLRKKLLTTQDGLKTLLIDYSCVDNFFDTAYGSTLKEYVTEGLEYFIPIYADALNDLKGDSKGGKYIDLFDTEYKYLCDLDGAFKHGRGYDEIAKIATNIDFARMSTAKLSNSDIPLDFYKHARGNFKDFATKLKDVLFNSSEAGIKSSLKQNHVICKAIYDILVEFENALIKKKHLYSVYSFNDIANFALSLLYDENSNLASDISDKYDEIYIDEYQDTNSVQDKLFKAISKKNRFMVGDIKQSIYRFRSAEPEIFSWYRTNFDKKENYGKDSEGFSVFMSNNFRCDKKIIEFSNLISDYTFSNSHGIPYDKNEDELIFSKDLDASYKHEDVELCLLNSQGLGKGNGPKYEAEYVAMRIKHMIDKEYLPNGEKINASHIAILLRNYTKNHKLYTQALEKYGISARFEIAEDFYEKPHVLLMLCILNAIDNPSRDIYLAGAMRSQVFNFSLSDLASIKNKSKKSATLYSSINSYIKNGNDDDLKKRLKEFLTRISDIKEAIKKMSAYQAISYIYGICGILSMCKSTEKDDLIKLYNVAREYEGSSFKGLYSFLKHIEKISDSKGDKSFSGDTAKENVKIMTIHSSKGLEFEICFICNLSDPFNSADTKDPILFQRKMGIAGYVSRDDGLNKYETIARKCISLQLARDMREEEMRVLYVAMTRARNRLILTTSTANPLKNRDIIALGQKYVKPYELYNAKSLYSFVIGGARNNDASFVAYEVDTSTLKPGGNKGNDNKARREFVERYKEILKERFSFKYKYEYLKKLPSKMSISKLYPEILDGNENSDIEIKPLKDKPKFLLTENEKSTAAEIGTATHTFMQFCNFKELEKENGVKNELDRLINESFISEHDGKLVSIDKLELFKKSSLFEEILKSKRVIREFRFNVLIDADSLTSDESLKKEKVLLQGVTDCIFETEDGKLTLVDYKTDDVPLDKYEDILREKHSTQLNYYRKACNKIFDNLVNRVLIYSVKLGKCIEVEDTGI